jgi:hypothetical protein
MFCPQCGVESPSGLQYCRSCGANLKVIGKALTLSEAIARSDRGPLPKLKEMVKNLKVDHVTEEVSRAFDRMNKEIVKHSQQLPESQPWWRKHKKTARERREEQITKGVVSLFSGAGLMVFLYYLTSALVLKLPPDVLAQIPFELDPVVHVLWLVGLVPLLSGVGRIIAGLLIRPGKYPEAPKFVPAETFREIDERPPAREWPQPVTQVSVTERTTNLLEPSDSRASREQ